MSSSAPDAMLKKSVREILRENQNRTSPLDGRVTLWAHDIRSMHNVGAFFRSADAFGITELLLSGYTPVPPRAEISKTALGADQNVPWQHIEDPADKARQMKKSGTLILGLEQTQNSGTFSDLILGKKSVCLILGNEVTGLDELFSPFIDSYIEIPQYGSKHSLNVSVAAGIALFALHEKASQL